ncbi:hypothetical protein TGRH88_059740 [Toxoplasma gondii]|uniref:Uncharacterized protein n=2 Tax=Toxoplasma gondii TaxID=5811 RepID=A0A3R8AQF4_TOXGO|nr:hypothetical protein TGRH88_059740 [Toxoplasma gondii]RQX71839.1 hypothetical protein TGCAST_217730 [Toxoplasma gondii CAST]
MTRQRRRHPSSSPSSSLSSSASSSFSSSSVSSSTSPSSSPRRSPSTPARRLGAGAPRKTRNPYSNRNRVCPLHSRFLEDYEAGRGAGASDGDNPRRGRLRQSTRFGATSVACSCAVRVPPNELTRRRSSRLASQHTFSASPPSHPAVSHPAASHPAASHPAVSHPAVSCGLIPSHALASLSGRRRSSPSPERSQVRSLSSASSSQLTRKKSGRGLTTQETAPRATGRSRNAAGRHGEAGEASDVADERLAEAGRSRVRGRNCLRRNETVPRGEQGERRKKARSLRTCAAASGFQRFSLAQAACIAAGVGNAKEGVRPWTDLGPGGDDSPRLSAARRGRGDAWGRRRGSASVRSRRRQSRRPDQGKLGRDAQRAQARSPGRRSPEDCSRDEAGEWREDGEHAEDVARSEKRSQDLLSTETTHSRVHVLKECHYYEALESSSSGDESRRWRGSRTSRESHKVASEKRISHPALVSPSCVSGASRVGQIAGAACRRGMRLVQLSRRARRWMTRKWRVGRDACHSRALLQHYSTFGPSFAFRLRDVIAEFAAREAGGDAAPGRSSRFDPVSSTISAVDVWGASLSPPVGEVECAPRLCLGTNTGRLFLLELLPSLRSEGIRARDRRDARYRRDARDRQKTEASKRGRASGGESRADDAVAGEADSEDARACPSSPKAHRQHATFDSPRECVCGREKVRAVPQMSTMWVHTNLVTGVRFLDPRVDVSSLYHGAACESPHAAPASPSEVCDRWREDLPALSSLLVASTSLSGVCRISDWTKEVPNLTSVQHNAPLTALAVGVSLASFQSPSPLVYVGDDRGEMLFWDCRERPRLHSLARQAFLVPFLPGVDPPSEVQRVVPLPRECTVVPANCAVAEGFSRRSVAGHVTDAFLRQVPSYASEIVAELAAPRPRRPRQACALFYNWTASARFPGEVKSLSVHPDNPHVVAASHKEGMLVVWDMRRGFSDVDPLLTLNPRFEFQCSFSVDGRRVLCSGPENFAYFVENLWSAGDQLLRVSDICYNLTAPNHNYNMASPPYMRLLPQAEKFLPESPDAGNCCRRSAASSSASALSPAASAPGGSVGDTTPFVRRSWPGGEIDGSWQLETADDAHSASHPSRLSRNLSSSADEETDASLLRARQPSTQPLFWMSLAGLWPWTTPSKEANDANDPPLPLSLPGSEQTRRLDTKARLQRPGVQPHRVPCTSSAAEACLGASRTVLENCRALFREATQGAKDEWKADFVDGDPVRLCSGVDDDSSAYPPDCRATWHPTCSRVFAAINRRGFGIFAVDEFCQRNRCDPRTRYIEFENPPDADFSFVHFVPFYDMIVAASDNGSVWSWTPQCCQSGTSRRDIFKKADESVELCPSLY